MPDISKITLPTGTTYDIKDTVAREQLASRVSYIVATTALNTPYGVQWTDDNNDQITGILTATSATQGAIYLVPTTRDSGNVYNEYLSVLKGETYSWELLGDTEVRLRDLGRLAYLDSVSGAVAAEGTVSTPTITVALDTQEVYTSDSASGGGSVTSGTAAACTLPVFATSVSGETLTLSWTAGSFQTNVPTQVTLPAFDPVDVAIRVQSATATQPIFTGSAVAVTMS